VPAAWRARLASCRVVTGSKWARLSDHNPIVAEFAAESEGGPDVSPPVIRDGPPGEAGPAVCGTDVGTGTATLSREPGEAARAATARWRGSAGSR
jgi:hypothetical protein